MPVRRLLTMRPSIIGLQQKGLNCYHSFQKPARTVDHSCSPLAVQPIWVPKNLMLYPGSQLPRP